MVSSATMKSSFLSLPAELRLRIYPYLLVCKRQINDPGIPWTGTSYKLSHSLLLACKLVHREARPLLYSENTFMLSSPQHSLHWFDRIGLENMKCIRTLRIFVDPVYAGDPSLLWYRLLEKLAKEATGVKHIYVYWDAEGTWNGGGTDVEFVRRLANLESVDELVIDGFYAKHWPEFLNGKIRKVICADDHAEGWMLEQSNFQRETEDLFP